MKIYLVAGCHDDNLKTSDSAEDCMSIFGAFSTEEKATEIVNALLANFEEAKENVSMMTIPLELDRPTEMYDFFMTNV